MITLPKIDKDGIPYLSYSQVSSWKEKKGFNTGMLGRHEYIRRYFLGEKFEDRFGFAQFGQEVEDYITIRESADAFSTKEREVLERITPLGNYQSEFKIQFPEQGFYVIGYIDDATDDFKHIRDYKTASNNSKQKYYEDDYKQLDVYSLAVKQKYGYIPDKLEVVAVERLGNGFRGGRNVMSVGEEIWYIDRETSEDRLNTLYNDILETSLEISKYWNIFCKLNKPIK